MNFLTTNNNNDNDQSDWNYTESDIAKKFQFFNILKDGRTHIFTRLFERSSLSEHPIPTRGIQSKDIQISPETRVRIFLPTSILSSKNTNNNKIPLIFYVHGGGFCMQSAFSVEYSRFVSLLVAEAYVIAVSIEYSLFPKCFIPEIYEQCWAALQWVALHGKEHGPEPWISDFADLKRIFVAGDSAGGNISHNLLAKVGSIGLPQDAKIEGLILIHPFFLEGEEMWMYMCPTNKGPRDHRLKPSVDDLARIGCGKVLVMVAEDDVLYKCGKEYVEELIKSGWKGKVEIMENKGKKHVFHLYDYVDDEAVKIRRRISSFIHGKDQVHVKIE